jgi:ABC-2 type transport system permease protein
MTVTWRDVARKDFEDVVRSKLLWGITVGFVGLLVFFLIVGVASGNNDDADMSDLLAGIAQFAGFFVPLIALIAGYMAIVGERTSGSLRVLLSYPFSRTDVVTGKVVGRAAAVTVAILAGFVAMTALGVPLTGELPILEIAGVALFTTLLAITFSTLAVGVSAALATRGRALALAVGIFFLLFVMWEAVAVGVYLAVTGDRPGLVSEPWYFAIHQANPITAFRLAVGEITGSYVSPMVQLGLEDINYGEVEPADLETQSRVEGSLPFYLQPWFSVVSFLIWAAVPLAVGYRRFARADLE